MFIPVGMYMYSSTYLLYVYGSQVWHSKDGGNSFNMLLKLKNDYVKNIITCPQNHAVIFLTVLKNVYYTRPGLTRYAKLAVQLEGLSTLICDHLGTLMKISLNKTSLTGLSATIVPTDYLIRLHQKRKR
uniref:cation channel sperm-associated auxiliary subunit beta-like n=1 Tax=Pristiophorus japonicus TaxID=55135 RepID=UPI00398F1B86